MLEFLKIAERDKLEAYKVVADDMNLKEAIIEKDFWVCLMLEVLFKHSKYASNFAFKGGTSLSKAYDIIKRFSEDIDLILDWRVLGYDTDEPWADRSKTAQRKFNDEANERAGKWIREELVPDLNGQFSNLGLSNVLLKIADYDNQTVEVHYPKTFDDDSVLQEIRLEIGPLAAWTPILVQNIQSYVSEILPNIFSEAIVSVPTVEAKRTFWEKATILHKEAHRTVNSTPDRYSRHYYDLYQLSLSEAKIEAFNDLELLDRVVKFKEKFYADNSAKYEDAIPEKLLLLPLENQLEALRKDYTKMQGMMFDEYPSFDEILQGLTKLENEIHNL
jgi:hypothetical protein